MIDQIKVYDSNCIAIEVIESITETDINLLHKFFENKLQQGYTHINILIKLDELKVDKIETKAFFEHVLWVIRNVKHAGNLAIVAHSNILESFIKLDAVFFNRLKEGFEERYFDSSQLDNAFEFIESNLKN